MGAGDDRVRKYFLFKAVTSFSLWMPFWTLWAYQNVDSLFLLTVVDAAFWTTMIAFQIPAGLFGDKFGRKRMLFLGEIIACVGVLSFGLSTEFPQFLVANIIWALGICFIVSGDTPYLYDTLLELNRQNEFISIMAKNAAITSVVAAIACITGGVLVQATDRLDLTLIISSLVALVGSFTAVFLKEPTVVRTKVSEYRRHLKEGFRRVMTTRAIIVLIMFQIVIEVAVYVMAVFRSVYMNEVLRLDYFQIGAFIGAFTIVGGVILTQGGKIERSLGEKRSLLFMLGAIIGSFVVVFLITSPIAILVQFLIYAVSYLQSPIISGYMNKRIDSTHRSTVVAIASMMFTLILTPIEILFGWLATEWGTVESLLVMAIAVTPVGFYLLAMWNKIIDSERSLKKERTLKHF